MKFAAKTEETLTRESLLPVGEYDFEVIGAEDKKSKNGNDMIELNLKVFRPDSGFVYVRDYLMEKMPFKLIHFCKTVGIMANYEAGDFSASDCVGQAGRVLLKIEEQEGYQPKNSVKDYAVKKDGAAEPPKAKTTAASGGTAPTDDGIPFHPDHALHSL
jgi:hypothetical protein